MDKFSIVGDPMDMFFREVWKKVYFSRDENINFATHLHDEIEIIYVYRGSGTAFCDGRRYSLGTGDVFVVFPEQIHSYVDCQDGEYVLLVINPSRLLYLEHFIRHQVPASALCPGTPALAALFSDALKEFQAESASYIVDGYLTAFLGKIFQSMQFRQKNEYGDTQTRILQYCAQHYQEAITAQELCRIFHVSQSYLSHTFTNRLHISFPNYINSLRLNRAVVLLREREMNMTQIAERAGFPTIRTFNRVFCKQFGCTPSEYRSTHTKIK